MQRNYVIASSVAVAAVAFVAITTHDDDARERRHNEDRARVEAQHLAQRRIEQQRAPPLPTEEPPGGVTAPPSTDTASETLLRDEKTKYAARLDVHVRRLERQIADLQAATQGATADLKTDYDRMLIDVIAHRDTLRSDIASIDTATDASWDDVKTRTDLDLQDLERSVRIASWRIRSSPRQAPR